MTPTAGSSTLLDRMVARVAEPSFALSPSLPAPAAWGEEVGEHAAPAPAPAPAMESSRPDPVIQPPQPAQDVEPQIITRVREVPSIASVAPLPAPLPDVWPPARTPVSVPHRTMAPEERTAEVPLRSEVMLRETTVFVPEPTSAPQAPPRASRATPAVVRAPAPANMQFTLVMPPPDLRPADVSPPVPIPVSQGKRAVQPAVQPDLPVPIPSATIPQVAIQPEPVIHVTIGRLEVRTAERERKSRPTERAAAPSGSTLEQYLAKRRGGGAS